MTYLTSASRPIRAVPRLPLFALIPALGLCACSERELRPITPCTSMGAQRRVAVRDVSDVDLVLLIDDSGSMREEQRKLREQIPAMVTALVTGDVGGPDVDGDGSPDGAPDGVPDGVPVRTLRVAVITSDLGVGGIGVDPSQDVVPSCGSVPTTRENPRGLDAERARYGDDGRFRLRGSSAAAEGALPALDCDVLPPAGDDAIAAADLPSFLTFVPPEDASQVEAEEDEFVRRVSCFANVGTAGCAFEQQLESVLKAITPAEESDALVGGRFLAAPDAPDRGLGHGSDPAGNGAWFRPDSLLALVLVTDEDDCSAADASVFDWNDASIGDAAGFLQSQTRCLRHGDRLHPIERYVQGILALRRDYPEGLVFAAITGIPEDLTDEPSEGTKNLAAILGDPRMQPTMMPRLEGEPTGPLTPDVEIRPACSFPAPGGVHPASGDTSAGSGLISGVSLGGAGTVEPGMRVTGPGIPDDVTVRGYVAGAAPGTWDVTLSRPATLTASGAALTFTALDVAAVPAFRIASVARGIDVATGGRAISLVQSICVASFEPAMGRILRAIQARLVAGCLPRPLTRTARDTVTCSVFVTLPPDLACDDPSLGGAYLPTPHDHEPTSEASDADGWLEVCEMRQVPAPAGLRATHAAPTEPGWFYDDYLPDAELCDSARRIAFTEGSVPPVGAVASLGCSQPVPYADLEIDLNSPCGGACAFSAPARADEFALRYNLAGRAFDPASDLVCEVDTNTCQIACDSDAECPGGFVCYDDPSDDDAAQTRPGSARSGQKVCVNPTCGG